MKTDPAPDSSTLRAFVGVVAWFSVGLHFFAIPNPFNMLVLFAIALRDGAKVVVRLACAWPPVAVRLYSRIGQDWSEDP